MPDEQAETKPKREVRTEQAESEPIVCPVCGEVAIQEKCKIICRSEKCRGRVVCNCSEF